MPTGVYKRMNPVWNKGLSKETDIRISKSSDKQRKTKNDNEWKKKMKRTQKKKYEKVKKRYETGKIKIWNKGLTKDKSEKVRNYGITQSLTKESKQWKDEKGNKVYRKISKKMKSKKWKEEIGNNLYKKHSILMKKRPTWNKGKVGIYSKETIDKIKKARAKQICPLKDTTIEVKIQNFLKELGITFFTHQYMKIEHGYQCDIFIPSKNLIIECDGDHWHKYPVGLEKDNIRTKELIEKGFKVMRMWEREIRIMKVSEFEKRLIKNEK